jgi:hypothetical protein
MNRTTVERPLNDRSTLFNDRSTTVEQKKRKETKVKQKKRKEIKRNFEIFFLNFSNRKSRNKIKYGVE